MNRRDLVSPCCWAIVALGVLLAANLAPSHAADKPQRVLLLAQGPDGHPAGTHEFVAGQTQLAEWLRPMADLEVQLVRVDEPWADGPDLLEQADCVVLYVCEGAKFMQADPRRWQAFQRCAARGAGLVTLHWACGCKAPEPIPGFLKLMGACHGGPDRRYTVVETDLRPAEPAHPIARGLSEFRIRDEFYFSLKRGPAPGVLQPVLTATIEGRQEMICWAWQRAATDGAEGGRSFGFTALHFYDNWQRPEYRRLVTQGVLWTLGHEIPENGLEISAE
ncbi:MAG: ThuA domain-containing protein [Pirellulales bacterium]